MEFEMRLNLNWKGIIAGTTAWFFFGFLWYGIIFAKQWQALEGITPELAKGQEWRMGLGVLQTFIVCCGLDWIRRVMGLDNLKLAIINGALIAFFFSISTISLRYIYALAPIELVMIDSGYQLIGICLAMTILVLLRPKAKNSA
jgi:hypothetical protein